MSSLPAKCFRSTLLLRRGADQKPWIWKHVFFFCIWLQIYRIKCNNFWKVSFSVYLKFMKWWSPRSLGLNVVSFSRVAKKLFTESIYTSCFSFLSAMLFFFLAKLKLFALKIYIPYEILYTKQDFISVWTIDLNLLHVSTVQSLSVHVNLTLLQMMDPRVELQFPRKSK